ncbi:GNAT family N-acetyltransferase [Dactylosporangium sp. NPDC000521]|uniref:GNAT family N-acetyltransferase n=1 Tax=Dactylosporangium sp. NPDC000521 TaxID=3363975 RepID=UPI0036C943F8
MVYPVLLQGNKVVLREFRTEDGEGAWRVVGDDRVTRTLSFDSRDRTTAQAMIDGAIERAKLDPRTEYYLAISHTEADELIGFVRLALGGVQAAKLGYALQADAWHHGYATDAVSTVMSFAFNSLLLHRVTAAIGPDNESSMRLVERLGFTREGVLRDHVYTNGNWRDSILYSALSHSVQSNT